MRLLGLSGSLRAASINTALLQAVQRFAPEGMTLALPDLIGRLPLFNPDDDTDAPPPAVAAFRQALAEADGVVIACPEYAHGVPGAFKNALDWTVASGEWIDKPFALFHASARSHYARASIAETLVTMNAHWVVEAALQLPLAGTEAGGAVVADMDRHAGTIQASLTAFADAIRAAQAMRAQFGALPLPARRPVFPVS